MVKGITPPGHQPLPPQIAEHLTGANQRHVARNAAHAQHVAQAQHVARAPHGAEHLVGANHSESEQSAGKAAHGAEHLTGLNQANALRMKAGMGLLRTGMGKRPQVAKKRVVIRQKKDVRPDAAVSGDNRRSATRVEIDDSWITFEDEQHPIRNISASGVLIQPFKGFAKQGDRKRFMVHIDDVGITFNFETDAVVVRVEGDSVAFKFSAFEEGAKDALIYYFKLKFGGDLFDVKA